MSITVNDGGTLRELSAITVNDNGTLRALKSISANDGGVLRTIYSKATNLPDTQTGHFDYVFPDTGANMQTLGNAFKITDTTTVTVNLSNIKYATESTKSIYFTVWDAQTNEIFDRNMKRSKELENGGTYGSATSTISASGNYIVRAMLFSANGNGSYVGGSCDYTITFS